MIDLSLTPDERSLIDRVLKEEWGSSAPTTHRSAKASLAALTQRIDSEQKVGGRRIQVGKWTAIGIGLSACIVTAIKIFPNVTSNNVPAYKEYSTTTSQRASLELPDGSTVQLAPQTVIRYDREFSKNGVRTVMLSGEAVFTVTNSSKSPFVVKANGTVTRVLGTTFGVRGYDKNVRVVVAEGKVSVNQANILAIGDMLEMGENKAPTLTHDTNVAAILGWTRGRLVYDGVSFREIATDLQRWYGIQIKIPDQALATQPIIAEFDNQKLEDVLEALRKILKVRYERSGFQVTFYSR